MIRKYEEVNSITHLFLLNSSVFATPKTVIYRHLHLGTPQVGAGN